MRLYNWAFFNRIDLAKERDVKPWDIPHKDTAKWMLDNMDTLRARVENGDWRPFSTNKHKLFARLRLYYFFRISYGTLIRPNTSLTRLKWHHIAFKDSLKYEGQKSAIINVPLTKKGAGRTAIGSFKVTPHILRWLKISKDFGRGQPDDYVFPRWDNKTHMEAGEMGRTWSMLLRSWGLDKDIQGRSVTMYAACRHQRISNAIKKSGWDLITLSKAADTSIMSISTSYADDIMEANSDRYSNTFKGEPVSSQDELDEIRVLYDSVGRR